MKNKLLLCILFFSFLQNANSQCNLICNPTFDGNNPSSLGIVNPFELLMVPCWREASITPQIVGTVVSNPFAASMWSLSDKKNTWGEGIITANALNLIAGKQQTTGCPDTTCITIIYKNCCELEYTQPFADPNGEVLIQPDGPYNYLHDTLMVITGTVRVMPGATWTIVNSKIILKECARIIVENGTGGAGGIKAAKMYVYNSNLMGCDWQGIEVWGRFDDCNADTADNTAGGSELQGKLIMFGDSISDADMAIFVGRRNDATIGIVPWQSYAGGVIDIEQCVFKNNFADIVFSEYSVVAVACELNLFDCPSLFGYSDHLVSRVELNTFDTLKTTEDCTLFLSTLLSSPGGYYGSSPWHCHIINFSDNPVWTMGPGVGGPPPVYNPVCNKLMLGLFSCDTDIRKKFNNNTYYIPCAANTNIPIPCYQNNNGYK